MYKCINQGREDNLNNNNNNYNKVLVLHSSVRVLLKDKMYIQYIEIEIEFGLSFTFIVISLKAVS